jgi:hypothetical protein
VIIIDINDPLDDDNDDNDVDDNIQTFRFRIDSIAITSGFILFRDLV